MKYKILLYGLIAAAITSCSSAYKASQTPDDVYYSPAREGVQKQTAKREQYEDYVASEDDQYLRMKIRNRQRWSGIDDYSYWNDSRYIPSYDFNYNYYRSNIYNPYVWNSWNSPYSSLYFNPYFSGGVGMYNYIYPSYGYGYGGYNPYGPTYIIKNPTRTVSPSVNRPNLNGYRNGLYNNNNNNNANSRQGLGNTLKRVFSNEQNSYGNSNNRNNNTYSAPERSSSPQRSYTPSSSSSSSSGSSSGSSGSSSGVSRPPR